MSEQNKKCTKCGIEKGIDNFSLQAKGKYGVTSICKSCTSERGKKWYRENQEKVVVTRSMYREKNREKFIKTSKEWREKNRDRAKENARIWLANNRHKKIAATARRRASLLQATPKWANHSNIKRFYKLAEDLTVQTGIKAHVDHIVPLRSKLVCGLHCEANLSILPENLNKRKGNLKWPDMP